MDIDYQRLSQAIMIGIADGLRLAREEKRKEELARKQSGANIDRSFQASISCRSNPENW